MAAAAIVPQVVPTTARTVRVRPVAVERLVAALPEISGWTRVDDRGETLTNPVLTARAEARYERNGSHVELEIADTTRDPVLLAPLAVFLAPGYAERSHDGVRRAVTIERQPAFEDWQPPSRRGEIALVVANRFTVRAVGYGVPAIDTVRQVVRAVDVAALAALK